jgi:hypothetical protein
MTRTARVLVACAAGVVLVVLAGTAGYLLRGGGDEGDPAPQVREAAVVDDLCATVDPLVPQDLPIGAGQSAQEAVPGGQQATCVVGGAGGNALEVRVTSYDLRDGDPDGTLDQLLAATCAVVAQQYDERYADEDDGGCSGQDATSTTRPGETTATRVTSIPDLGAVVSVTMTQDALPAQVAAYTTALALGLVGSDPTG